MPLRWWWGEETLSISALVGVVTADKRLELQQQQLVGGASTVSEVSHQLR